MRNNYLVYTGIAFFILAAAALPFDRFMNFTSTLRVNGFVFDHSVIWVASNGGLYRYNPANNTGTLYTDPSQFPDPNISSLCIDAKRTLWIGTGSGYLYKRPQQGRQTVVSSYFMTGWSITGMVAYGKYLIIGSEKGCSVFDTEQLTAVKTATSFGTLIGESKVNTIAIFRDTLLLGCEQGVAKLFIGGDKLTKANFYDPSIWLTDTANLFPVKSFIVTGNGYRALRTPAAMFNGQEITIVPESANDTAWSDLFADGNKIMTIPSNVTAVKADNSYGCLIGTAFNYFYVWNGNDTVHIKIDGPTFSVVTRVYVDREGLTWACSPKIRSFAYNPWWEGISFFSNGQWTLFSPADAKYSSMGSIPGGGGFRGIDEDPQGRMWFGTPGGQVKRYDRGSNSWLKYCIGAKNYGLGQFFASPNCLVPDWAESDAVACDSTGFLWIATWVNDYGSLICYDPRYEPVFDIDTSHHLTPEQRHYRFFFPDGDPNHLLNVGCLCVDPANNIIVGDETILVLSHDGHPLTDSVRVKTVWPSNGRTTFDAVSTPIAFTYIATSTGLYTYLAGSDLLMSGLYTLTSAGNMPIVSRIDSTLKNVLAVEAEDQQTLWLGTIDSGLIRYDLLNNNKTIIDKTQGLLSNNITDLSIDRKNGYLWIASDRGVSRYTLGYSIGKKNVGTILVYPNPFSKRRHLEMVFEKLPPSSKVFIYSVSGTIVTALSPQANSSYGSTCVWNPPAKIVPGIYLYAVQSSAKNSQGKIIITP